MNLELGEAYIITPIRFDTYGAIVELQDGSTSLLHVSQISENYVKDPSEYLSIGQEYVAKGVQGIGTKPVQLSLKHLGLKSCYIKPEIDNNFTPTRKKPYPKSKPVRSPRYTGDSVNRTKSLDDMIADAQASYNEKMKGQKKRNKKR